jgi:hypothetical protein
VFAMKKFRPTYLIDHGTHSSEWHLLTEYGDNKDLRKVQQINDKFAWNPIVRYCKICEVGTSIRFAFARELHLHIHDNEIKIRFENHECDYTRKCYECTIRKHGYAEAYLNSSRDTKKTIDFKDLSSREVALKKFGFSIPPIYRRYFEDKQYSTSPLFLEADFIALNNMWQQLELENEHYVEWTI